MRERFDRLIVEKTMGATIDDRWFEMAVWVTDGFGFRWVFSSQSDWVCALKVGDEFGPVTADVHADGKTLSRVIKVKKRETA